MEIGDLCGTPRSGVTQAIKRFEEAMKKDRDLEEGVLGIPKK